MIFHLYISKIEKKGIVHYDFSLVYLKKSKRLFYNDFHLYISKKKYKKGL